VPQSDTCFVNILRAGGEQGTVVDAGPGAPINEQRGSTPQGSSKEEGSRLCGPEKVEYPGHGSTAS